MTVKRIVERDRSATCGTWAVERPADPLGNLDVSDPGCSIGGHGVDAPGIAGWLHAGVWDVTGACETWAMPRDEPPEEVVFSLEEALTLLAALEDGRDAPIDSGHLAVVVSVEAEIRLLSRRPGIDDDGGTDGR